MQGETKKGLDLDVQPNIDKYQNVKYIPNKLLVGGGPPNASPRVNAALCQPTLSAVCREIHLLMDDVREMLKYIFQTTNPVTLAMQTTGTGGLEAALVNTVEPGETVLVGVSGSWGLRLLDIAKHRQTKVIQINSKPGEVFSFQTLEEEIKKHRPVLLFLTHGETSMGVLQPLEGLGEICHRYNCLLAVDAIISLGCVPLFADRWEIDIVVSSSNKAMRGPAGIAYLTFSSRAVERIKQSKTPPPFFFNILSLGSVWNCFETRTLYHNTFTAQYLFAAKEGINEIIEQGLENAWENHRLVNEKLRSGMEKIGCKPFLQDLSIWLPIINLFYVPYDINAMELIRYVSNKYHVELGFGITPETVKLVRIGIMGYNARNEVVDRVLEVLEDSIQYFKYRKYSLKSDI